MKIISIVANNPIFIELQYKTLQKFVVGGDYEYIIFNDGKDFPDLTNFRNVKEGRAGIIRKCAELKIKCINIPNAHHIHNTITSRRHSDSLRFVLQYMKSNMDEYLMLDSDMFLIDHLDLNVYRKHICACVLQERPGLVYFWPNLFYLDMRRAPNINRLNMGIVLGGDTGSASSIWLKSFNYKFPPSKTINSMVQCCNRDFYMMKCLYSLKWDKTKLPDNVDKNIIDLLAHDNRNKNGKYFYEIYDNRILHYRGGTNWMNLNKELHSQNISLLVEYVTNYMNNFSHSNKN
jgi:hypothetical protein